MSPALAPGRPAGRREDLCPDCRRLRAHDRWHYCPAVGEWVLPDLSAVPTPRPGGAGTAGDRGPETGGTTPAQRNDRP